LNNFVGEFLVLQGAAIANYNYVVFAAVGVILSAVYMLWLYQRTFLGREPSGFHMPDLNGREWAAILPLIALMIWMGIAPQTFLPVVSASNARTLSLSNINREFNVKTTPVTVPLVEAANAR
jgi:NADH-quinone oxidoreductase subunit M